MVSAALRRGSYWIRASSRRSESPLVGALDGRSQRSQRHPIDQMVAPNILVHERRHRVDDSDQDHQIGRKPMQFINAVADCGVTRPEFRHGPYSEQFEAAIGRSLGSLNVPANASINRQFLSTISITYNNAPA